MTRTWTTEPRQPFDNGPLDPPDDEPEQEFDSAYEPYDEWRDQQGGL
jgi:hypothetical protein